MANVKLSELPAATSIDLSDIIPIVQSATAKKAAIGLFLDKIYPVGSIYINTIATSPAVLFNFGTWVAFGVGRVMVGLDSGDAQFDTLEETGGALTHTLTRPEMPGHTHIQDPHTHPTIQVQGSATPAITGTHIVTSVATGGASRATTAPELANAATAVNQSSGGGLPHNNVQPYIVVNMWKRTA
jgi:hypothetical protein